MYLCQMTSYVSTDVNKSSIVSTFRETFIKTVSHRRGVHTCVVERLSPDPFGLFRDVRGLHIHLVGNATGGRCGSSIRTLENIRELTSLPHYVLFGVRFVCGSVTLMSLCLRR